MYTQSLKIGGGKSDSATRHIHTFSLSSPAAVMSSVAPDLYVDTTSSIPEDRKRFLEKKVVSSIRRMATHRQLRHGMSGSKKLNEKSSGNEQFKLRLLDAASVRAWMYSVVT